jgi:hypothetical protein
MSDPHLTAHCIYNIPCECGRSYVGETGRPLSISIGEHKFNLKNGLLCKSKLAQHAFEEGHQISWNEAKILQIEVNSRQRKYKESAHMACMEIPISQPSLEFPPSGFLWSKRRSITYREGATSSPSILVRFFLSSSFFLNDFMVSHPYHVNI